MGNTHSYRHLMELPPDAAVAPAEAQRWWQEWCSQEWRSDRARELDELGGLVRRPIARGESFSCKLAFLGDSVLNQAQIWENMLEKHSSSNGRGATVYNTDGTVLRAGDGKQGGENARARAAARSRSIGVEPTERPQPPPRERGQWDSSPAGRTRNGGAQRAAVAAAVPAGGRDGGVPVTDGPALVVAEWRVRTHAARRRVLLIVLTIIRLRSGLSHPTRLRRVESFSFAIPLMLGGEVGKFVEEARAVADARAAAEAAYAAACTEEEAAEGGEGGAGAGAVSHQLLAAAAAAPVTWGAPAAELAELVREPGGNANGRNGGGNGVNGGRLRHSSSSGARHTPGSGRFSSSGAGAGAARNVSPPRSSSSGASGALVQLPLPQLQQQQGSGALPGQVDGADRRRRARTSEPSSSGRGLDTHTTMTVAPAEGDPPARGMRSSTSGQQTHNIQHTRSHEEVAPSSSRVMRRSSSEATHTPPSAASSSPPSAGASSIGRHSATQATVNQLLANMPYQTVSPPPPLAQAPAVTSMRRQPSTSSPGVAPAAPREGGGGGALEHEASNAQGGAAIGGGVPGGPGVLPAGNNGGTLAAAYDTLPGAFVSPLAPPAPIMPRPSNSSLAPFIALAAGGSGAGTWPAGGAGDGEERTSGGGMASRASALRSGLRLRLSNRAREGVSSAPPSSEPIHAGSLVAVSAQSSPLLPALTSPGPSPSGALQLQGISAPVSPAVPYQLPSIGASSRLSAQSQLPPPPGMAADGEFDAPPHAYGTHTSPPPRNRRPSQDVPAAAAGVERSSGVLVLRGAPPQQPFTALPLDTIPEGPGSRLTTPQHPGGQHSHAHAHAPHASHAEPHHPHDYQQPGNEHWEGHTGAAATGNGGVYGANASAPHAAAHPARSTPPPALAHSDSLPRGTVLQIGSAAPTPKAQPQAHNQAKLAMREAEVAAAASRAQKAELMLGMYVNRANAAWMESQAWGAPRVWELGEQEKLAATGRLKPYRDSAIGLVRRGGVGVVIMAAEDAMGPAHGTASPPGGGAGLSHAVGAGGSSAAAKDLWTSDPYDLISHARPGILQHRVAVRGYSLQGRALAALAAAAADVGGPAAVAALRVVLCLSDDQAEDASRDLWEHGFYGLTRAHVLLLVQPRRAPYVWDTAGQRFTPDPSSSSAGEAAGSGYAAMQLAWAPEAMYLDADGVGCALQGTVLEALGAGGVSWLVSARARDLSLLVGGGGGGGAGAGSPLDPSALAHVLFLREARGVNIVPSVALTDSLAPARAADSILLSRKPPGLASLSLAPGSLAAGMGDGPSQRLRMSEDGGDRASPPSRVSVSGRGAPLTPQGGRAAGNGLVPETSFGSFTGGLLARSPSGRSSFSGTLGVGGAAGGSFTSAAGSRGVVELRLSELATPRGIEVLAVARAASGGRVAVGLGRAAYHLPSLRSMLTGPFALRPKLRLRDGGGLHVALDAADLTALPGAVTAAMEAAPLAALATQHSALLGSAGAGAAGLAGAGASGGRLPLVLDAGDADLLLAAVAAQDTHTSVMAALERCAPRKALVTGGSAGARAGRRRGGGVTVVFVDSGGVGGVAVKMALGLARPGQDVVHVMTVVSGDAHVDGGRACVAAHLARMPFSPPVELVTDVVVKPDGAGLLDVLAEYAERAGADLLVLGSHKVTSSSVTLVVGSVALAAIKRVRVPVLLVTPNAGPAVEALLARRSLRTLAVVEGHALGGGLYRYVCGRLMAPRRGDRLVLGQVYTSPLMTRQQEVNMRRWLSDADGAAAAAGVEAARLVGSGVFEDSLCAMAAEQGAHVVALQLPPGGRAVVPAPLLRLMQRCRAGVLLVQGRPPSPTSVLTGPWGAGGSAGASGEEEEEEGGEGEVAPSPPPGVPTRPGGVGRY